MLFVLPVQCIWKRMLTLFLTIMNENYKRNNQDAIIPKYRLQENVGSFIVFAYKIL